MKKSGFTLIEIMITVCVVSIVAAGIGLIYKNFSASAADQKKRLVMQQNGRAALRFISNELLNSGYSPIIFDQNKITGADYTTIQFFRPDTATGNQQQHRISYNPATGNLTYTENITGAGATPEIILDNVAAFSMLYGLDRQDPGGNGFGELEKNQAGNIVWATAPPSLLSGANTILTTTYSYNTSNNLIRDNDQLRNSTRSLSTIPITSVDVSRIRAVKIILLVRSDGRKNNKNISSRTNFIIPDPTQGNGFLPATSLDNNFTYKYFTTTIKLRNMYYL